MNLPDLLRAHSRILVFTGAGVSTGSGIPDFRGPNGIWKKRPPVYFDEFLASAEKRADYWEYKAEGYEGFRDARPTGCHLAITRLAEAGKLEACVTQNIDGLHQAAGTPEERLLEIHGTNRWVECTSCGVRDEPAAHVVAFRESGDCPTCEDCGGWLKFATISFGQNLDSDVLERAAAVAATADLAISLGSTLSVHPAASIPRLAAQRGVPYVVINRGETDQDGLADLRLEGDVEEIFPSAVEEVLG